MADIVAVESKITRKMTHSELEIYKRKHANLGAADINARYEEVQKLVPFHLTNESFFIAYGYPCKADVYVLADQICGALTYPWRVVANWLSDTIVAMDILLSVWMVKHCTLQLETGEPIKLTANDKTQIVQNIWTKGPTKKATIHTYADMKKLTSCKCESESGGIESLATTYAILGEPLVRTFQRMKNAWCASS